MPDACFVTVAKELNALLAAPSPAFSQSFTPVRSYAEWDQELKDDDNLHVDTVLVTHQIKSKLNTRASIIYSVPIDVGIRQRLGASKQQTSDGRLDPAAIDALLLLTEEINERLIPNGGQELDSDVNAKWKNTEILVAPSKQHLREFRQFTSIIRVLFEVTKTKA